MEFLRWSSSLVRLMTSANQIILGNGENEPSSLVVLNQNSTANQSVNFRSRLRQIEDELPDVEDLNLHSHIFNVSLIFFYSLLTVVSLVGNGLVCRVLATAKHSSYPIPNLSNGTGTSKMLIMNLAVSDLLLTTFNIPMNIVRFVSRDWPFGSFICTMMPFIQSVSAYCSSWTMMVIAFERYRKIFRPKTFHRLQQERTSAAYETSADSYNFGRRVQATNLNHAGGGGGSGVEITLTNNSHHHVLWRKINPSVCGGFGRLIRQLNSKLCYSCCTYCCCCCPQSCFPSPPPPTSAVSRVSSSILPCSRRFPASVIISFIWGISVLLSLPHSLYSKIVHYDYIDMTRCTINAYPSEQTKIQLTLYTVFSQYVLPIGITTYCYLHIGVFLWRRETVGALSEGRRLFLLQRKRKRVRMLIMVVAVFAICWFPLNLYIILTDFNIIPHHLLIFFIVHWFAMSSVCYNPFIYCWLNEMFRQKSKNILKCLILDKCWSLCCRRSQFAHIQSVSGQMENRKAYKTGRHHRHGIRNLDSDNKVSTTSWSSTTMSATGQQQAISELISMSALLEQDLLDSNPKYAQSSTGRVLPCTKEQRLALMTTQSGRRRYHSNQLMMMLKMNEEPATKTTSINLISSVSSSGSLEEEEIDEECPNTQLSNKV